jgi:serine/threonine protein kinase
LASYRGIKVVVKEMKERDGSASDRERCRREVLHEANILQSLGDHPGLPLLFGVCSDNVPYSIVLQFHGTETGNLTLLMAAKKKQFNKAQTIVIFQEICQVLNYIHTKGFLHNDLKSNNVLLEQRSDGFRPVVIDFGKSRKSINNATKRITTKRSFNASYLAPEVKTAGNQESTASDIYSLGKMLESTVSRRSFAGCFKNIIEKTTAFLVCNRSKLEDVLTDFKLILKP